MINATTKTSEEWQAEGFSELKHGIAKMDRRCSVCSGTIPKGASFIFRTKPTSAFEKLQIHRTCRACRGLCCHATSGRSMSTWGTDRSCDRNATGKDSKGIPSCGLHNDVKKPTKRSLELKAQAEAKAQAKAAAAALVVQQNEALGFSAAGSSATIHAYQVLTALRAEFTTSRWMGQQDHLNEAITSIMARLGVK